jgi:hypothetical protein
MKWPKRTALALLAFLAAAVLTANVYLGKIAKTAVERIGPSLVGVSVKLDSAQCRLLRGAIRLNGLVLGNPAGFKTDKAISMEKIAVDVDIRSLRADTIRIKSIVISQPEIVYELGMGKSNLGQIQSGMDRSSTEEATADKGGRKVMIDDLLIQNIKVRVSAKVAQGEAVPMHLPDIHLMKVGEEPGSQGATRDEVVRRVLGALMDSARKAAGDTVGAAGRKAKKAGQRAGGAVEKGARSVMGRVKGLFGGKGKTNTVAGTSDQPE